MQILNKKKGDEFIQVEIERIWADNTGIQIALTPNGDYITLNGELVQDPKFFKIMPDQDRKEAEGWWRELQDRKKAAETEDREQVKVEEKAQPSDPSSAAIMISATLDTMRKNQEEFFARLAGLFADSQGPEAPPLKAVYTRRKGESINCTAPKNWNEFGFTEKPDWWGIEQKRIEMGKDGTVYTYERFLIPDDQGGDQSGD